MKFQGFIYQSYAKPIGPIHDLAYEAHGLSEDFLSDSPDVESVIKVLLLFVINLNIKIKVFLNWVNDAVLVAHNMAFDIRMLCQVMDKYNLSFKGNQKVFCTQR